MKGVASTTSSDVEKLAQTRSGMRQKVIPGARMVMIVTRKLRAVMIEDAPGPLDAHVEEDVAVGRRPPTAARSPSSPLRRRRRARRSSPSIMKPAIGSSQYESAFRRGNAMSGAPIISGRT